jgi:hypothetical protein
LRTDRLKWSGRWEQNPNHPNPLIHLDFKRNKEPKNNTSNDT